MSSIVRGACTTVLSVISTLSLAESRLVEQIIVTATRTESLQFESPAPVSVITHEQIERSGALAVADVLRSSAGLQIRDTIGDGGRGVVVSMRGFGENAVNNTLVMVDGRRLNNPSLQGPDLNGIALKDIERIEILQGGGGVLFGDQAVGGVINVITRAPQRAHLDIEAGGGSNDARRYAVVASHSLRNGIGMRLSAEHRESDNYRDNNAADYSNVFGLLEYRGARGRVFGEAQYVDDELEFPGALPVESAREDRRQSFNSGDYGDLETLSWRIGGEFELSRHWSLEMELTDRDMDGNGRQYFADNQTKMRVSSFNPRLVGEFEMAAGTARLTAGFDATRSKYQLDIPDWSYSTDFKQEQRDVYAQAVLPVSRSISVSAGARRSHVDDTNRVLDSDNSDNETVVSVSLAWQIRDDLRWLLRRDEVLRYANVDENAVHEATVAFLKPQTGVSLETGIEWYGETLGGRVVVFNLELDDEILYDPNASSEYGPWGANKNEDSSRRRGAMLEWHWQAVPALRFAGNYTLTDADIRSGSFDGNEVPYTARHVAALNAEWEIGGGLAAYAEYLYTGSRYAIGDDANAYDEVGSESVVNLALRWQRDKWRATLRANNLAGEKYDTLALDYGWGRSVYPAPGRTLQFTIGYSL